MNDEQQVRRWVRKILHENKRTRKQLLAEYGSEYLLVNQPGLFYHAFIDPFVDVLKVAGVGLKDVLTDVIFQVRLLFTINAKVAEEIEARYLDRKKAIAAEMDAAFKSTATILPDTYAQWASIAPGVMTMEVLTKSADKSYDVMRDLAKQIGLDEDNLPDETSYEKLQRQREEKPLIQKTVDELEQLFMNPIALATWAILGPSDKEKEEEEQANEAKKILDAILSEGEDIPAEPEPEESPEEIEKKFQAQVQQFMELPEVQKYFDDLAKKTLEAKNAQIDELTTEVQAQLQLIENLVSAISYEDFIMSLQSAETAGISIDAAPLAQLKQQVADGVQKILNTPDSRMALEQTLRAESDLAEDEEVPENELVVGAQTAVFMKAKEQLQEELYEGTAILKDEVIKIITADLPEGQAAQSLKETEAGKQYFELIEDSVTAIKSL